MIDLTIEYGATAHKAEVLAKCGMATTLRGMRRAILTLTSFISVVSCSPSHLFQVGTVEEEGRLIVLTHESPITYYMDANNTPTGYEYELTQAFAKDNNLKVEYKSYANIQELLEATHSGEGHLAAGALTVNEARKKDFTFTRPYHKTSIQVVCGKPQRVRKLSDLAKLNLVVAAETSYEDELQRLAEKIEGLDWNNLGAMRSDEVLEHIWLHRNSCTLADETLLNVHRHYFPELRDVYSLKRKQHYAWILTGADDDLEDQVDDWLRSRGIAIVKRLNKKYYSHRKPVDHYDLDKFKKRIRTRLPKYKKIFKEAERQYKLPWKLLAAISYQESLWDPMATSPTGVKGLMMLTKATAKQVGVKDRTNPKQSILGGTQYLHRLIARIPDYVRKKDRIWFALAAYNVGLYHLRDAMSLAVLENLNPTRWTDVRGVLPLLAKSKYNKRLRYGYARGLEPVIYVDRIRNFHQILQRKNL